jgi:hypothetical protein
VRGQGRVSKQQLFYGYGHEPNVLTYLRMLDDGTSSSQIGKLKLANSNWLHIQFSDFNIDTPGWGLSQSVTVIVFLNKDVHCS